MVQPGQPYRPASQVNVMVSRLPVRCRGADPDPVDRPDRADTTADASRERARSHMLVSDTDERPHP